MLVAKPCSYSVSRAATVQTNQNGDVVENVTSFRFERKTVLLMVVLHPPNMLTTLQMVHVARDNQRANPVATRRRNRNPVKTRR